MPVPGFGSFIPLLLAATLAGLSGCSGGTLAKVGEYCDNGEDCAEGLVCTSWNTCLEPGTFCDPPCDDMNEACVQGSCQSTDGDGDGFGADLDCDDDNADVHPDAAESCNLIDDDCDGETDEGCDCVIDEERSCGVDEGECAPGTETCLDTGWGPCLDASGAAVQMPGDVEEVCNYLDDDCDGRTDEECTCVVDEERPCGEGVGECVEGTETCLDAGWGPCLDASGGPVRRPGDVTETCNELDDDCDGHTDEGEACFPRPDDCNAQDWCLEYPIGNVDDSGTLSTIHGRTANDVWAVGVNGVILHFDGFAWGTSSWAGPGVLQDVWSFAADDVWAVGFDGLIMHYTGTLWLSHPSPTDAYLVTIAGLDPDKAWAAADRDVILRWDGDDWSVVHTADNTVFYDAFAFAQNDVWVVGNEYGPGGMGKILHFDGAVWSEIINLPPDLGAIHSIWGTSSRDVWLADTGWGADHDGRMVHYDGTVWDLYPFSASLGTVVQVWGLAQTGDVWAVHSDGSIRHWDGSTWATITPSPTDKLLNAVWAVMTGPTKHVWVAGRDRVILHHIE